MIWDFEELINKINGHFGMSGLYVPKGTSRGELVYFSPTNERLFQVYIYRSSKDGWVTGGGALLLDFGKLDALHD